MGKPRPTMLGYWMIPFSFFSGPLTCWSDYSTHWSLRTRFLSSVLGISGPESARQSMLRARAWAVEIRVLPESFLSLSHSFPIGTPGVSHSCHTHLLSTCCRPGTELCSEHTAGNKIISKIYVITTRGEECRDGA